MNFSLFALASVLATTASAAAGPIHRKTIKLDNQRRGEPSTEALLKLLVHTTMVLLLHVIVV